MRKWSRAAEGNVRFRFKTQASFFVFFYLVVLAVVVAADHDVK